MRIELLPDAKDLIAGRAFYEGQALGLGNQFVVSLASEIDALGDRAGIHPHVFGSTEPSRSGSPSQFTIGSSIERSASTPFSIAAAIHPGFEVGSAT